MAMMRRAIASNPVARNRATSGSQSLDDLTITHSPAVLIAEIRSHAGCEISLAGILGLPETVRCAKSV